MPTRFDLGSCCVLPIRGQANVAPPIAAINSRRCTAYSAPDALNPSVSNFRHRSKRSAFPFCAKRGHNHSAGAALLLAPDSTFSCEPCGH
jgi:hypothetical protein